MAVFTALAAAGMAGTALVATGTAIYGTAASISASNKAMRAQKQATQVQIRQQKEQTKRARRSAVRQSIMARARAANVAATQGLTDTSAVRGGLGGLSSQLGANLGYGSMMSGLSQQLTSLSGLAAQAQGQAQLFGQVASLAMPFSDFGAVVNNMNTRIKANRAASPYGPPRGR